MHLFSKITDISQYVHTQRGNGLTIGFVPTMGALHEGHLSLVDRAKAENDIVIVSIFVNPIQFNNPDDLVKYPRDVDKDTTMLKKAGVDAVFTPSEDEMYPEPAIEQYEFGALGEVMEGAFRPGHFNGVAIVVHRLLNISQPHRAYFGEKDFQQLAIIKSMVKSQQLKIDIIGCPIHRESDGLARSSRNERLSASMREAAPFIYKQLLSIQQLAKSSTASELTQFIEKSFSNHPLLKLEYFSIANADTLQPVEGKIMENTYGFIAVYAGDIRLIDNIRLI